MKPYTIAIAGSTQHTVICAKALQESPEFEVLWTLTPDPKPIGRDQSVTKNPLHQWSEEHAIPSILVNKKIDERIKNDIEEISTQHARPDFLLVVDFGYIIPDWLLALPAIAPLNIHPSLLPKWRGSSPGQFVLLYGEKNSAVTLMEMNAGLDTGPIIHQEKFAVNSAWTQTEYYAESFNLISKILVGKIVEFGKTGKKIEQPQVLPITIARRLKKEDGFISWTELQSCTTTNNQLLAETQRSTNQSLAQVIEQASRAFSPWPVLWTVIPTAKGEKRMQILKCHIVAGEKIELDQVKIEGQEKSAWVQVKNQIL